MPLNAALSSGKSDTFAGRVVPRLQAGVARGTPLMGCGGFRATGRVPVRTSISVYLLRFLEPRMSAVARHLANLVAIFFGAAAAIAATVLFAVQR